MNRTGSVQLLTSGLVALLAGCAVFASPHVEGPKVELDRIGSIQSVGTRVERGQPWMLGCETLDRDFTDFDSYKEYLEPLGIRRIRLQSGWAKCEKVKGQYDFAWLDHVVDYAAARGIRSVLETDYGNPIYGCGWRFTNWNDEQWRAWDAWVRALAEHFKGRVEDFLMWNEPNVGKNPPDSVKIARQNIRTAKIIKSVIPTARIGAFSYASCRADKFRESLVAMGEDAKLFTWVVYHGYVPNPDAGQRVPVKWGEIVAEVAPHLKLFQGEQGAPSKRLTGYALANHDWTELSQAKWDLRRYVGDIGHGVESSVFTIADICYKDKGIHNAKGLLATDLDCHVIGVKKSYRAVQNMVSVFDDSLELLAGTNCPFSSSTTNLSVYSWRTKAGGRPLVAFWDNQGLDRKVYPTESLETRPTTLVYDGPAFTEPVWVDLISGNVHAFPKDRVSVENGRTVFRDVPFYDAPCLLTERSVLRMKEAPCVLVGASLDVEAKLETAHRRLIEAFLRPEGLLCDYVGEIPTPKDCVECRPNAMGWWSPIENGPMFTGPYLAACVERARRLKGSSEGERAKAECAKMVSGLIRAASVSDVPGMIVRGFGTDGKCHYPLGSTDQTLPWFYGLHAYWRSGLPSPEEKATVRAKMIEVAGALERNDWGCPCDGRFKGENRGSFASEGKLYFRAATHGLYLYAAMYEVTGEAHWRDLYVAFRDGKIKGGDLTGATACEAGWSHDAKAFPAEGDGMWIYVCAQGCLKELIRMERDAGVQARYRRGLVYNAERARQFLARAKSYDNKTERPFRYANWRTGYAWRDQPTQKIAGQVAGSGNRKILGTRKGYERGYVTTPLSAAAVCAFAGLGQEDVAKTIAHYDFKEISICEFFLAEVAWYAYQGDAQ